MINLTYSNHDLDIKSWDELGIGDVYLHIHTKEFCIKTGKQSYFSLDEHSYHYWSKMLQESNYKNFIKCSYKVSCFKDIDQLLKEWRSQF